VLPNPFYVRELRLLSGRDEPVKAFLDAQPEAAQMLTQIETFVRHWLPGYEADSRGLLTVALGCTGGQHRSVYGAQWLWKRFADRPGTLIRHRELDGLHALQAPHGDGAAGSSDPQGAGSATNTGAA
jgi:UPF0042 nucleotide-binding protein